MPVRGRKKKRRAVADAAAWYDVFSSEFDFNGDLADAGLETDAYGRPDWEEARKAWQRLGQAFLEEFAAEYPNGAHYVPWGLEQFGDPPR
ncbi:hypothetical protein IVB34_22080 [Bradyrhizobium sp. 2]|uniref:hypothetical protein n=1 Tax=unclassified Bradyrhizobium TaxID=2631580 RepID=UPI001FF9EFF7|nr:MULTISPECIES: hypothetical protein [unclassified Bradyrhizobium]MCK1445866.1 hypothetical protein [Bradyrhizobium sp. 48]MCK1460975.1 hypothetical protein [Bradyrhizobium sp. 2]